MTRAWMLLPFLSIGCATVTPAGQKVRVTANPEVVRGCKYIGEVKGSDRMWGGLAGQGIAEDNAVIRLKNKDAAMGGNVVLMTVASTNTSGSSQRGEAHFCPE